MIRIVLVSLVISLLPATALAEDELLDRVLTEHADKRAQKRRLGSLEERVEEFNRRALRLNIKKVTVTSRAGSHTTRTIDITNGEKRSYDLDELPDLTDDLALRDALSRAAKREKVERVGWFTKFAGVLAPPAVLGLGGLLLGGLGGVAVGILTLSLPTLLVGSAIAAVVLGLGGFGVGLAIAFGFFFFSGLIDSAANILFYFLAPRVPDEHYALLIHQHNVLLAKELGLKLSDVDAGAFPLYHVPMGAGSSKE